MAEQPDTELDTELDTLQPAAPPPVAEETSITHDPIYYSTVGFFALLATAFPAILGQAWVLPILQTVALTVFVGITLHHRNVRGAVRVMTVWLIVQFLVMSLLTLLFNVQLEAAFIDGFAYRAALTTWFFGGTPHPDALGNFVGHIIEFFRITLGSLFSAGLYGVWLLVRLVNLAAFGTGILLIALPNPALAFFVIPYWTLLRAAGYAGLVILCAMPLLTYTWSPAYYWRHHRRLILASLLLVLLGIVVELFLPGLVNQPPIP